MNFTGSIRLWKLWKLWKRLPCQIPIIQMRLDLMQNDHDTDTADREERASEGPNGELEVRVEDVLPRLRSMGRRPPKETTTTGR